MYQYHYTKRAIKDLKELPKNKRRLIFEKLEFFFSTPNPLSYAKTLTNYGLGQYRFRVGDYRVTFDVEAHETIFILHIGHRREIYH